MSELTQTVMQGLFGGPNNDPSQGLPNSAHWYDAIDLGWTYASGGVTYSLSKRARTTLQVVDSAGRIVTTLLHGSTRTAGDHQILWDGATSQGDPRAARTPYR